MAVLIGVAFAIAIPASATAATYCVHTGGSCLPGEIDEGSNLQAALTAANGSVGVDDRVKVGAGTYGGPFTYPGAGGAVQITGVGPTTILNAAPANGVTVLDVVNAGSRVENLHIDLPLGNSTNQNVGLGLNGGTADGVSVQIPSNPTGPVTGVDLVSATFRNGSVLGPMPAAEPSTFIDGIDGSGMLLLEDSTVHVDNALELFGGGTLRRLDLQGRVGFQLQAEITGGASGDYLIEDDLWRSQPGSNGIFVFGLIAACGTTANMHATVRNLTLIDEEAAGRPLTAVCNGASRSTTLDVTSTIARGGDALNSSTSNGATVSTLNLRYSDFEPANLTTGENGVISQGAGNVSLAPGFAGVGDFHLAPGSPLIDIGDPAGLAQGESPTDLAGAPRILNGTGACSGPRRDIGAHEAAAMPLQASCTPTPPTQTTQTTKKKCKKRKKHKRSADAAKKKKKCKKRKKKR
jgi:hypothetical protein